MTPGTLRRHGLFVALLGVGALLRVITFFAYRPALLYYDSFRYLSNLTELDPSTANPIGYIVLLLRPLLEFDDLAAIPRVQHLIGLAMGVLIYAVLLRCGARRWLAALAAAPVLLDGYQLQIEQNVMADTLFQALVLVGLSVLVWRRPPGPAAAGAAGLVLGLAVTVRLVGQPLVLPAVLFVLLAGAGRWRRVVSAAVLVVMFAVPVLGYAAWYQRTNGEFALSPMGSLVLYARVAPFADCSALALPPYQEPLCPTPSEQERYIVDDYVWDPTTPARQYETPPGMRLDAILRDFATRVIANQPLDFLAAVGTDFLKGFSWSKTSSAEDVPVDRWQFQLEYPVFDPVMYDPVEAVEWYGGTGPSVNLPLARFLRAYQLGVGYTPGTVLLAALVAGLLGVFGVGGAKRSGLRPACLLWALSGGGLLLAPAFYEFSWRYQLPGLVLLPVAGALGVTAMLRHDRPAPTDDVDARALEDFHHRYGDVSLSPVAVVIAAYDEQDSIGAVLARVPARACGLAVDVVVVVDGATDDTTALALRHGAYTCVAPVNRGQGAALRLGYRIARRGGAAYIATLDADGQYDPAELPIVLDPLVRDEADFVTGSRRLGREETTDAVRRLGVRVFARLVSALTGQRITDTSNGLRAMKAGVTEAVTLTQPQYQAAELLIGALARGFRVAERPTTMRDRTAGVSKKGHNGLYALRYARVVLAAWRRERAGRRVAATPARPSGPRHPDDAGRRTARGRTAGTSR